MDETAGAEFIHRESIENARRRISLKRKSLLKREASLYDRTEQQQVLRDIYYRSKDQTELAIITG
jgi:hypothetical protein